MPIVVGQTMQARRIPALRGAFWLVAGFQLYKRNVALLSLLTFAHLLLTLLCSQLLPLGPFLLLLATPVMMALIAQACRLTHRSVNWSPDELFNPLGPSVRLLLRLGMLQIAYVILAILLTDLVLPGLDAKLLAAANPAAVQADGSVNAAELAARLDGKQLAILLLHAGALMLLILPAFWFAPLLTHWHALPPLKAVFFSAVAVWRNWAAFLVYALGVLALGALLPGLLLLVFGVLSSSLAEFLAAVARLAIMLVLAPVLASGAYLSYCDILAPLPSGAAGTPAAEALGAADETDEADAPADGPESDSRS